ncbi:LuxR C-terminal-related transcriptional regulator [Streptomyces sp. NPDC059009]|uniref:helix-turn-helix transcriptional regulator n=1 Tax=Streptomyces sp. NPDC059009 TaxID=3346694 RepID=UPI0036C28B7B
MLEHHTADPDALATGIGIPRDAAERSVTRLHAAGLLQADPENEGTVFAVAPETASARRAAPLEARIREEQRELAAIQAELDRFLPYYHLRHTSSAALDVLANVQEVRAALNRASARCRTEMLTSQPGGGSRVPEAMQEALGRDRAMLERGISIRTLYHHTARFNGPSQAYVAAASALGAQYRTCHVLFGRLIVFDRELAFIPVQDDSWGAVAIREPATVSYLCQIFEHAWEQAKPFADAASQGLEEVANEIHETILRLLAAGLKDEAIARRLGMSLRTARRHIADIMEELDAASRFQAGAAAATRGLLDRDSPAPA